MQKLKKKAIARTQAAVVAIIIVIAIIAGSYVVLNHSTTATKTTPTANIPYNESVVVDETLGEPSGLDVAYSTDAPAYEIEQNIYQGLIWYQGNGTTQFAGVLATNWSVSPDGKLIRSPSDKA